MSFDFARRCMESSNKTSKWLAKQIISNGKFADYPDDLACYYKAPYFLAITGELVHAQKLVSYLKRTFFNTSDFSNKHIKTENPALNKFWGYVIAWIGIGAQKLGDFEISYPAYQYLRSFYSADHGGFATHGPWGEKDDTMDILTTAHFGKLSLYMGDKDRAIKAAEFLTWMIHHQSDIHHQMFLASNNHRDFVKNYHPDEEMFYVVKKESPHQAYFMIGYPCAFLTELYAATRNPAFLESARRYAEFALGCHENIKSFPYSHKVAWAMSLLYRYTKDNRYLALCESIGNFLMSIQSQEGVWLEQEGPVTSIDQTIENAIWLREIATNISL